MNTDMNLEIFGNVINNSTWICNESETVFKFSDGKDLFLNGKIHLPYKLCYVDKKPVIQIGDQKSYFISFVNDFTLIFHNNVEKFKITPE